ncbi:MAG: hypothetical protein ACR2G4_02255 [Pyrinomonadaceae bacterium]
MTDGDNGDGVFIKINTGALAQISQAPCVSPLRPQVARRGQRLLLHALSYRALKRIETIGYPPTRLNRPGRRNKPVYN